MVAPFFNFYPKSKVKIGTVNLCWRIESRYIDFSGSLDGMITRTIHLQEYGTGLWIG
jgi:hypothetical protein